MGAVLGVLVVAVQDLLPAQQLRQQEWAGRGGGESSSYSHRLRNPNAAAAWRAQQSLGCNHPISNPPSHAVCTARKPASSPTAPLPHLAAPSGPRRSGSVWPVLRPAPRALLHPPPQQHHPRVGASGHEVAGPPAAAPRVAAGPLLLQQGNRPCALYCACANVGTPCAFRAKPPALVPCLPGSRGRGCRHQ